MARAPAADEKAAEKTAEAPAKRKGPLLIIIIAVLATALVTGLGSYFAFRPKAQPAKQAAAGAAATETPAAEAPAEGAEKPAGEGGKKAPAQYLELAPSFTVNLEDDQAMRYLQVDIQVMTRDVKAVEEIKQQMPRLRNALMLLFSQQRTKDISTREGKEALQRQALAQVQAVMQDETGSPAVEALYFTNFVMQ
jgi:flagellar FliL protein